MTTLIVFSKDRALQCDALLRSVYAFCTGIHKIVVIVKASTEPGHIDAYRTLEEEHPKVQVRYQVHPVGRLLQDALVIAETPHVGFAVDDQIFYAPSDYERAARLLDDRGAFVWSWRLGDPLPNRGADPWSLTSLSSSPDYGYLWHLDGSIYRGRQYLNMLDRFYPAWRNAALPNDIEGNVAARKVEWAATVGPHLGPARATCCTWQVNRVQTQYGSPFSEHPETSTDALLRAYLAGKRLDVATLVANTTWVRHFNPPGARPTHVYPSDEASEFYARHVR